jgi:hypothetical protein
MKMGTAGTIIILWTLSLFGVFIGGEQLAHYQDRQLPPKNRYITQIQNTENKNTSIQESSQAQFTIVTPMTNFNINYNGKTNISVTKSSRTNKTFKSNK